MAYACREGHFAGTCRPTTIGISAWRIDFNIVVSLLNRIDCPSALNEFHNQALGSCGLAEHTISIEQFPQDEHYDLSSKSTESIGETNGVRMYSGIV